MSLSETIYGELKPFNVGVSVVCPSFFQTNLLNDGRLEKVDRDTAGKMMKSARFNADDVAAAAIDAMNKKRLYVILPAHGRFFWRLKRFFPNYFANLMAKDWAKQVAASKSAKQKRA